MEKIKKVLVKSIFYRLLLVLRSRAYYFYIKNFVNAVRIDTVYCISPYKTGTTYFSGLFESCCAHEPLMHATITNMDDLDFLKKRAAFLRLDLECSGFFADKLSLVREFAPGAKVIFLSRHPEDWIGSVVNYFSKIDQQLSYNYVARLIFDPICDHPVEMFYSLDEPKRQHIVEKLLEYWICVYSKAKDDDLALVVPLNEIDAYNGEIECFAGLKIVGGGSAWRRENTSKKNFTLSEYVDVKKYRENVRGLGYEL